MQCSSTRFLLTARTQPISCTGLHISSRHVTVQQQEAERGGETKEVLSREDAWSPRAALSFHPECMSARPRAG